MDITEVKGLLKTYCKQNHYKSPKYKIVFINEEDYKKLYTVCVEIKGVLKVADSGISRRIAEKKAAIKALVELKIINKPDVDSTEDQVVLNHNNNDNDDKPGDGQLAKQSDKKELKFVKQINEFEPIVKVKVNEVSKNIKNIGLSKPSFAQPKQLNKGIEIKYIDENLDFEAKKKLNQSTNDNNIENKTQNKEQNITEEDICQLEENPICGLIKYCLRKGTPLPFYDFSFNEGKFSTQCRVDSNGTEFIGFGRSSTLRLAKMIASQEVINELKKMNLYFSGGQQKVVEQTVEREYKTKSKDTNENKYTEYSTLTINMMSTDKKTIENNVDSNLKSNPSKENFEEFEDCDRKHNSSTLNLRDDNNNPKESLLNTNDKSFEQNFNLIIDNPIGYLQKYSSKNKLTDPKYEEEHRSGQDHCPIFWYKCSLETKTRNIIGIGGGNSKKAAKKAAAEEVVRLLLDF